jgi:aryl-alcohol dehydrogenase-like predicted oxidoreductase
MSQTNRREFFRHSFAFGAAAALPVNAWPAQVRRASDVIELGPAKVKVSRLAIGTGTIGRGRSSNQMRKLGAEGLSDLFWYAYDNGVFFWDSADGYGSHDAIKVGLKKVPREKVTIMTKTDARTVDQIKGDLERFRQEMGTDYIDIVLLHARRDPKWDELDKGLMDVLSEAKEKKIVRSVGISCHSVPAMQVALKSRWLEVFLCPVNFSGARMDGPIDTVLSYMAQIKAAGKGVLGMKILGEGQLRDRVDDALRFTLTKDVVNAFTIGAESRDELKDLMERIPKASVPA